jgi:hypothetical protein
MVESSSHLGVYSCLAVVSGGDGMDSVLEYILSDVRGLLRLRPFVPDSLGQHFVRSWG